MLDGNNEFDVESWETDGRTPLITAAEEGHEDVVQLLLNRGADPSGPSEPTWLNFPLHAAVDNNQVKIAAQLTSCGASISTTDRRGYTPLLCAAYKGFAELVELFLDMGADIGAISNEGDGVLQHAVWFSCDVKTTEALLRRGATLSDEVCADFLFSEIQSCHPEIVRVLLKYGADPNLPIGDRDRRHTPLMVAVQAGDLDSIEALIQHGARLDAQDAEGKTALHYATTFVHVPSAKMLLDAGANVLLVDEDGFSAMMRAEWPELVAMMLDKGADPNHVDKTGLTVLANAALCGYEETLKLLLDAGADVHHTNDHGWTALYTAVRNNCPKVAGLLLAAGADPQEKASGHYALVSACNFEDTEMVEVLLKNGADISSVCCGGMTPLYRAADHGYDKLVELLLGYGADMNALADHEWSPLLAAASGGYLQTVRLLLEHGAHLEHAHASGYTALLEAIAGGHENVVDLLLSKGARVDVITQTGAGSTALSVAALHGNCTVLRRLLPVSTWDMNRTDLYGRTALLCAAMRGNGLIVESLLAHAPCPDLHVKDHWGATALLMASRNGHVGIVQQLFETAEYNADILREKDSASRTVFTGAVEAIDSTSWTLLGAAVETGMGTGEIEKLGGDEPVVPFNSNYCYCDVCGRCSTCSTDNPIKQCTTCETDGGGALLICNYCVDAGLGCLSREHTWQAYEKCSCQNNGDDDSNDGDEEQEQEEDENGDGSQAGYGSEAWDTDWEPGDGGEEVEGNDDEDDKD